MKKNLVILLAMLLCICVAACVANANAQAADPTEQTSAPTTVPPTLETIDISNVEIEKPTLDINVPTPDEMPTLPEGDFHVPPGARPEPPTEVDTII